MKLFVAGCLMAATLTACERREGEDTAAGTRTAADTIVTQREVQDTAIVTHDTTVSVDTQQVRGERTVDQDTIRDR